MKTKSIILVILIILGGIPAFAQKAKPVRKPKPVVTEVSRLDGLGVPDERETVPEIKDFAYVVDIDENSNIKITVQKSEDVEFVSNTADPKPVGKFFAGAKDKKFAPIIIVRPGERAYWGDLQDVLKAVRNNSNLAMKMETAPAYYAFVPPPEDPKKSPRPNPLTLIVSLDKNGKLALNNDDMGSFSDLSKLGNTLKQIFKDRESNGVFREGSNEVEKTVFVKADRGVKFAGVMTLIAELRNMGADRIGIILVDKMPPFAIDSIE
jgi:biopolymer transport protein ExbD